jgi:hypothetical protein
METRAIVRESAVTASELAAGAFRGEIVTLTGFPTARELGRRLRSRIETLCGDVSPPDLQSQLDAETFRRLATRLRARVAEDEAILDGCRALLRDTGHDLDETFWDHPRLRIVPGRDVGGSARLRRLAAHRDTWGSNLWAQVNWWMNLYPHPPGQGLVVYPHYWDTPIDNTSGAWDFEQLLAYRADGRGAAYPRLPLASRSPEAGYRYSIEPDPDQPVVFSGAHLHASGTSQSHATRLNVELRTLRLDDLLSGAGAPNLDGRAPRVMLRWFTRVSDGVRLAAIAARRGHPVVGGL